MSNEVKHNSKILYNLQLHDGCNPFVSSTRTSVIMLKSILGRRCINTHYSYFLNMLCKISVLRKGEKLCAYSNIATY